MNSVSQKSSTLQRKKNYKTKTFFASSAKSYFLLHIMNVYFQRDVTVEWSEGIQCFYCEPFRGESLGGTTFRGETFLCKTLRLEACAMFPLRRVLLEDKRLVRDYCFTFLESL